MRIVLAFSCFWLLAAYPAAGETGLADGPTLAAGCTSPQPDSLEEHLCGAYLMGIFIGMSIEQNLVNAGEKTCINDQRMSGTKMITLLGIFRRRFPDIVPPQSATLVEGVIRYAFPCP